MITRLLGFAGTAKGLASIGTATFIIGLGAGGWVINKHHQGKEKRVVSQAFDRLAEQTDLTQRMNKVLLASNSQAQRDITELAKQQRGTALSGTVLRKQLGDALNDIIDPTPCACTDTILLDGVQQSISKAYTEPLVNLTTRPATNR